MSNITPQRLRELTEFQEALSAETDRGCALLELALIDAELGKLIAHSLVGSAKVTTELLSPLGPLGTLSARIDIAYAMGLIAPSIRRDLHILRKIRNEFGHSPRPISFKAQPISNRCGQLHHVHPEMGSSPREYFVSATIGSLGAIHGILPPAKIDPKVIVPRTRTKSTGAKH